MARQRKWYQSKLINGIAAVVGLVAERVASGGLPQTAEEAAQFAAVIVVAVAGWAAATDDQ